VVVHQQIPWIGSSFRNGNQEIAEFGQPGEPPFMTCNASNFVSPLDDAFLDLSMVCIWFQTSVIC
jgi:hypothetical protein